MKKSIILVVFFVYFVSASSLFPEPGSGKCGLQVGNKILGGTISGIYDHPWLALLEYTENDEKIFECGGALINENYVLTAAHCVNENLISVRLGEWNISSVDDCIRYGVTKECTPPPQDFNISESIRHPDYDNLKNDIALIRLSHPANTSVPSVKPICLPLEEELLSKTDFHNTTFEIAGWGRIKSFAKKSSVKLKVELQAINSTKCQEIQFQFVGNFGENIICAGGEKGKDSCQGDSGAPLVAKHSGKDSNPYYYAAGILGAGPKYCGNQGESAFYHRLSAYIQWIQDNVRE